MAAELSVQHCITIKGTKKNWKIPSTFMKEDEYGMWLQVRASCYGLCNILVDEKLDPKSRPTLKESYGYKYITALRNVKVFEVGKPSDELFGGNDNEPRQKKKKVQKEKLQPDQPLEIEVGVGGPALTIRTCSRPSDDLVIAYNDRNINTFIHVMRENEVKITTEGEGKRSYNKTGKHAKRKDDSDEEASQES